MKIGIDIGGTNTKVGAVSPEGEILTNLSFSTQIFNSDLEFINVLTENIYKISEQFSMHEIEGIGIGAPNGNYYTGIIENAPNIRWGENFNIIKLLSEKFKCPIKLTNDANAAAVGELKYGKGKSLKNFIVITLGTGLGCGLIINGQLYHGHNSLAGELGHINAVPEGRLCGCGKNGCLETYASATGLRTTILEMLNVQKVPSLLRNIDSKDITSKVIYDAAVQKDPLALRAFDFTGKILGEKLSDIIEIFDPEAIFFFGGLAESGDILIEPVRKYMENSLMGVFKNKVKLEQSGLINKNAAILGACALI